jgi:hypothetical protein
MPSEETKANILMAGAAILTPVLEPHGFVFTLENQGKSSGGDFASGAFSKLDRRLELHFRSSLGLVAYHLGQDSLDHETYMRLLGVYGTNQYPDFPREPLDSFHHLAADIQRYCQDFTNGYGQQFGALVRQLAQNPNMFKGMS